MGGSDRLFQCVGGAFDGQWVEVPDHIKDIKIPICHCMTPFLIFPEKIHSVTRYERYERDFIHFQNEPDRPQGVAGRETPLIFFEEAFDPIKAQIALSIRTVHHFPPCS
jgi:hypothetical protein